MPEIVEVTFNLEDERKQSENIYEKIQMYVIALLFGMEKYKKS